MENLLNENICLIIMLIIVILAIIVTIILLLKEKDDYINIVAFIAFVLMFYMYCIYDKAYNDATLQEQKIYEEERQEAQKLLKEKQKQEEEIFNKKLETYKFMIDGREVDREDIDISLYNLVINDEKETIFMTGK